MELTTKEAFKRAKVKPIDVDGDRFYIRVMKGRDRDTWNRWLASLDGQDDDARVNDIYAGLLVRCLCDPAGTRLYEDTDAADLATEGDSRLLYVGFHEAQAFNKLTAEAMDESKNVSGGAGNANSGSSSPPTSTTAP